MSSKDSELAELQSQIAQLDFKLEALGWRLAAHAREVSAARERLDRALGTSPTTPLQLRPLVKAKPRT